MEQHPVPQNISTFEFKLFGNLTIRQFVTLVIPLSAAALIFFSNLPTVFRMSFAIIVGGLGTFVALIPINGRPFDKWIVSFIKAVLAPTQRIWVKEKRIPEFLNVVTQAPKVEEKISEESTIQGRARLLAYLKSLPRSHESPLDIREEIAVERLQLDNETSSEGRLPPPILWASNETNIPRTSPEKKAQIMHHYEYRPYNRSSQPTVMQAAPKPISDKMERGRSILANHARPYALPKIVKKIEAPEIHFNPAPEAQEFDLTQSPRAHLASETNFVMENIIPIQTPTHKLRLIPSVGQTKVRKLHFAPPPNFDLSKLPIRGEKRFEVSEELKKRFRDSETSLLNAFNAPIKQVITPINRNERKIHNKPELLTKVENTLKQFHLIPKSNAKLEKPSGKKVAQDQILENSQAKRLEFEGTQKETTNILNMAQIVPLTNKPNVISGIITNNQNQPQVGAVVILRDQNGTPLRALKTNKLGQFLSATPLSSGTYTIEIEAENAVFKTYTINLENQILSPLEIRAES